MFLEGNMPARTLFWLNPLFVAEPFGFAESWTTAEGSSTPAGAPPTSIDDTEIDTTATISGSGSASVLNINAGMTVSGSLNTDVTNATVIGNSAAGSVTIGTGASWTLSHRFIVGGAADGQVTIKGGGSLTTDSDMSNSGSSFDDIGFGGGVGSVLVTGAGSKWTSNAAYALGVGSGGTLSITDGGEVQQTRATGYGGFFLAGGSMSVDGSSIAEAGTLGGAKAGFLTIDANGWSGGIGTYTANIIDNGNLAASDAGGFQGNGTLTINGAITGTGYLTVGAQETLALNGPVSLTGNGSVDFYGWYGTLAIDDAPGFSSTLPIYNFEPGDTIDLKNVPFVSAASSYSFTYGSNGGPNDLRITEGGQTYNFNVGTYFDLTGLLTLKADASGTGTDIVYTSGAASPLQRWGSTLPNFFTTASGPVDGSYWALSNSDDGAYPVWEETETPAGSYVKGQAAPYTIVLTTQDWIGTQQPLVTVATTNLIDPFGSGSQDVGNLAGSVYVSNTYPTGTMDLIYWKASTTPGDYAIEFQPIRINYPAAPTAGPSTVLTGGPTQIDAAISQPLAWNLTNNYTGSGAATEDFFGYSTFATATTENIFLQGISTSGVASTPVLAATITNGTWWGVSYNNSNGNFYYVYYSATGASGAGFYSESFNTTTGALGAPSAYLLTPGLTSVSGESGVGLSDGTHIRFVEGFQGSQQVIQAFVGNGSPSPATTFDLSSTSADRFAITTVTDPNDGYTDYTVLAYTDDNQVHLELLNNYGDQIGSDLVVPGITSFDRLHSLFNYSNDDYRVELDYTVPDPKGGTQVEGIIYDTSPTGDYTTLGGGAGEYVGTPFDDTFIDAPGNYTINGGGDQDIFQINQTSNQVLFSLSSSQQLAVSTYSSTALTSANLTGTTTLKGFTRINLNDRSILESTSAGGGVQLDVQGSSNFAGTIAGFAAGDSIAFDGVTYAAGDHAVFTSNASGGGTVAIDNSGGTQVASFNVQGYYPWILATVSQGTGGIAVVSAPTTPPPVTADILWQSTSGQASIWEMDGNTLVGGGPVTPNPGPSFRVVGTGDFNNDGHSDILWQNTSTGQASIWEMNGSSLIGGGTVNPNPGPAFHAVGAGDFNGDGFSDILWQNTSTGQASIWEMNGNSLIGGGPVTPNAGLAWKAIGTGDFNKDGDSDILWQNTNTGQVSIWEMDGNKLIGGGALTINPGTAWQAIGTGDFDKSGFSDDILFQNKNTGQVSVWEMDGTSLIGGGAVSANPGLSWHAIGTGGAGGSDILLQNTSGQATIWDMSGNTIAGGGPVSPSPGPTFRAVGLT
jgi:T5SS/PEP-CTERM-associated repeat protein